MKLAFTVHLDPKSDNAAVAMELILADPRYTHALEEALKREIEIIMGWQNIRVCVERMVT